MTKKAVHTRIFKFVLHICIYYSEDDLKLKISNSIFRIFLINFCCVYDGM